jgi:hypothetical protein
MADTPSCVTRAEFDRVSKGMTKARVHSILDVAGTWSGGGAGGYQRIYPQCRKRGAQALIGYSVDPNHRTEVYTKQWNSDLPSPRQVSLQEYVALAERTNPAAYIEMDSGRIRNGPPRRWVERFCESKGYPASNLYGWRGRFLVHVVARQRQWNRSFGEGPTYWIVKTKYRDGRLVRLGATNKGYRP